ncbi:RES family NAD+ phosphorylase [Rubrivirga sp. S365]|uniref:RES family NAD+ phosphorylase n=1 Tax=Rubrivirga sp. S365 TaxID=3076080 RepID=UPI0028C786DE|nr:RES family NAD+ phosphorylase [Rubrivirga sp. S365]MDT7858127.1 RES family NAD+ phosphorylase [Rubrivirga sp. S365]
MVAWRVVPERYARSAFDGEGARLRGGRFNGPGTAAVYAADSLALAVLEVAVHLPSYRALLGRVGFRVEIPDALVETVAEGDLPSDWRSSPPSRSTQALGDAWVREGRSVVLRLPSVLLPHHTNVVLNPAHPAFGEVIVGPPEPVPIDPRLIK